MKEFKISIVVSNEDDKYTEDEIVDLVDDWCEEHALTMGGGISELINDNDERGSDQF